MDAAGGVPEGERSGWERPGREPGAGSPQVPGLNMLRLLGVGGHGEVWLADDLASGDRVAVKVRRDPAARLPSLDPADAGPAGAGPADADADGSAVSAAAARLTREVALLRRIDHPHVVRLRRVVDLPGGARALVMDHAAGGSLADLVALRGPLDAGEAVSVLTAVAGTLADLHERGLVHGDLTPSNVLFTADGRPMIADLGCAVVLGELTREAWGSPGYCDPARTGRAGPVDDIYSLGALLRFALTGDPGPDAGRPDDDEAGVLLAVADLCAAAEPERRPGLRAVARTVLAAAPPGPIRLIGAMPTPGRIAPAADRVEPVGPVLVPPAAVHRLSSKPASSPTAPAWALTPTAPTLLPATSVDLPLPAGTTRPAGPGGDRPTARQVPVARAGSTRSRSGREPREPAPATRGRAHGAGGSSWGAGAVRWPAVAAGLVVAGGVGWWAGLLIGAPEPQAAAVAVARPGVAPAGPAVASAGSTVADPVAGEQAAVRAAVVRLAQARAAAFRSASADLLAGVDEPGSPALQADLALVGRLRSAGVRLAGLSFAVDQVRVGARGPDGAVVVTARVTTSAHAQQPLTGGGVTAVPASAPRDVVLTLAPGSGGGGWLVRAVS